jgi:glycosyltransferase involved in cell wall biosynthesis
LVCDTDSVWSRYVLRELPYSEDKKRKKEVKKAGEEKEREEKAWVGFCDITTGVSSVDVAYYQDLAEENNRIKIFSNVINIDSYRHPVHPPPDHVRPSMYLAGTFWKDSPMEKASRWVLEEVLPIVKESIPNIHFYIIGRGSDSILSDITDKAVTVTGMVDSVLPYLCNVDVSIVPLTFESGTRFKILEAAACGIPIVSTTLGAEGIPVTHGENILIADNKAEFASSIIKLIQDKDYAMNISQNCLELVIENYGIDGLVKEGKEILTALNEAS